MNYYIILFILLIIFIIIAYFIYKYYSTIDSNKFVPNNEFKSNARKEGSLILFYVTWCPYCKVALDKWSGIKQKYTNTKNTITFSELDCDKFSNMADKYNITAYPTIILVKNDKKYIYDAELDQTTLELFINTVMNE